MEARWHPVEAAEAAVAVVEAAVAVVLVRQVEAMVVVEATVAVVEAVVEAMAIVVAVVVLAIVVALGLDLHCHLFQANLQHRESPKDVLVEASGAEPASPLQPKDGSNARRLL